ncbi:MAG: inositol monophosphatase family protein, partial [Rhizobiaceae bacterium]
MRGQSDKLREALETLAVRAGRAILEVQRKGVTAALKTDNTPVTEADKQAEAIILDGLARLAPDIPVIAEEAMAT